MNRYLIHVSTNWCGMDNVFRAIAESEDDLHDIAQELAYDNFESYNLWEEIAREEGYDLDEMTEADWGDINPATKEVEGNYGSKYTGCVSEKDSLITEENGFKIIETLEAGVSPLSIIYQRDLLYSNKSNN